MHFLIILQPTSYYSWQVSHCMLTRVFMFTRVYMGQCGEYYKYGVLGVYTCVLCVHVCLVFTIVYTRVHEAMWWILQVWCYGCEQLHICTDTWVLPTPGLDKLKILEQRENKDRGEIMIFIWSSTPTAAATNIIIHDLKLHNMHNLKCCN